MANKGARRDYTDEDVIRIKEENKRILDELFSNPNWRYELGRKHFGEARWQKVFFGEKHPEYLDWKFDPNREYSSDTTRPISEWDNDGNLIDKYDTVEDVCKKYEWETKKGIHILDAARNKQSRAYNRVWKFDDLDNDFYD